jgi:hypothetical protein
VPKQYRTQLERLGAPAWSRWILLGALVCVLVLNLGLISYVWSHQDGGARKGLLIALWVLTLVAVALLIRLGNALRRTSRAQGATLEGK